MIEINVLGKTLSFEQPTYSHLVKLEQNKIVSEETYNVLKSICKNPLELAATPATEFVTVVDLFREVIYDDDCKIAAFCPNQHKQLVAYKAPVRESVDKMYATTGEGDKVLTVTVPGIETFFNRLKMCESQTITMLGVDEDMAKVIACLDEAVPVMALSKLNECTPKDAMRFRKCIDRILNRIYEPEIISYKCDVCGAEYKLPIHMSTEFWLPIVE